MSEIGPLSALALRFGSDKWGSHSYTMHYEAHFAAFRDKPINLLEIGIGGYEDPAAGGASLRMWENYFSRATIYALDMYDKSPHATNRVKIYQGSQIDGDLLSRINGDAGGFDIIIDDGSHHPAHVIASFEMLFPYLKPGGLYIVEDTQTSYWPSWGGSTVDMDSPATSMGYFKGLIHGLNHAEIIRAAEPSPYEAGIVSMHFYHNLIMLYKGDNMEPSNVATDHPARQAATE